MTDNAKSPILSKNVSSSIGLEPPLRFPGFEGEWLPTTIGEICDFQNGKAHEKDVDEFGKFIIVNSKFISSDGTITKYSNKQICPLYKNDIVMVMSDVPKGKAIAKCLLIDKDNKYTLNQRICSLRAKETPFFYLLQINRNDYFLKFDDGVKQTNLRKEDILSCPIYKTMLQEQQKIADFLSLVDERIEKQRQLVEVLKRYKRGLFSSIYSAKQLNWKSVCVGDFSKVYGGYAFDSKTYSESGKYNVLTIGNVSGNRYADIESCNAVEEMPVDIQQYQILQPDDLVVSMTGNVGRVSIVNQDDCLLNQRVAKLDIKDSTIREYVYQVLSCSKFEQEMNNVGQGAAQKNIKNSDIENFIFYIPENNTELNTLARLFLGLDNIILKQEQQLAKLMQSKQSLLQQMFI